MENYEDYIQHVSSDIEDCLEGIGCQPILFVGSGFSRRYINAPSWEELLQEMAKKCPLIDKDYAYYKQSYKDPIRIGTVFSDHYKEWAWGDGREIFPDELFSVEVDSDVYLKHAISKHLNCLVTEDWQLSLEEGLKAEISMLKDISPHAIITTNYDCLIEGIFPDFEPVVGQKVLRSHGYSVGEIFKIHGSVEEPESLVLTEQDYDQFNSKKKYLSAKLLALFIEHPLVFIGYGANDPNIKSILSDISEIICSEGELIPNIYILEYSPDVSSSDYPVREKVIIGEDGRNIRVKAVVAKSFQWVYQALSSGKEMEKINPKLLRSLLARTFDLVRKDIPRKTIEVDFETLEHAANSQEGLAKIYGITTADDPSKFNMHFPYTLTQVGNELGFSSWHNANKLLEIVTRETGINLKASDNKYHLKVKLGQSSTHKYSRAAVELLQRVQSGEDFSVHL